MSELDTLTTPTDEDLLHLAAARARRRLLEADGLVAYIRTLVVPPLGGASDGMPRAASKTPPLPLRADAVDDTDDTYARLIEWVSYWAGQLTTEPPVALQVKWAAKDEPAGFRAGTTPAGAGLLVKMLTTWLLTRQDQILGQPAAQEYLDDVADIVWKLRSKYPRAPRPERGVLERPCPVCDRFTFGATWPGQAAVEEFELVCSFCGHSEAAAAFIRDGRVRELLHELREEHADPRSEWWTKRQAQMELDIGKTTLNRYIADGDLQTYTVDGTVYVSTEDLLTLWRTKRAASRGVAAPHREI
ncbi:hypothetical protein EDF18_0959 [Frigoribacterium sp. PhB107]|uniref:helix-turn-helix domain-containing protein n=1 Tax=Frigoribacterium sp. PhB107 TaxID=2485172 RepID=UPI000F48158A|nr:helix-turn-helix domain-containing protein [Frigoribacterium sp. PhB107]ROP78313.1 hypothetical protein EDF18_0959 [Frigoribacterium sp. PhB107]